MNLLPSGMEFSVVLPYVLPTLSSNLQLPLLINKTLMAEEICKIQGVPWVGVSWIFISFQNNKFAIFVHVKLFQILQDVTYVHTCMYVCMYIKLTPCCFVEILKGSHSLGYASGMDPGNIDSKSNLQ